MDDLRVETMGCVTVFVSNDPDRMNWRWLKQLFGYHGKVLDAFIRYACVEDMREGPWIEWTRFGCLIIDICLLRQIIQEGYERF